MFVIFVLAVKNQGLSPGLLTDGHVANSPACPIKSRFSNSPACSDVASTLHWPMSDVSSSHRREALRRARLQMLRYGSHGCVFTPDCGTTAHAPQHPRPL